MDRLLLLSERLNEINTALAANAHRRAQMLQTCAGMNEFMLIETAIKNCKYQDRNLRQMWKDLIGYTVQFQHEHEAGESHVLDLALADRDPVLDGFKIPDDVYAVMFPVLSPQRQA